MSGLQGAKVITQGMSCLWLLQRQTSRADKEERERREEVVVRDKGHGTPYENQRFRTGQARDKGV